MYDGFVKVAMCTPRIALADPASNAEEIIALISQAASGHAQVIVFPELCITGYTCGDLFFQRPLLTAAMDALSMIAEETDGLDAIVFVGLPVEKDGKLYNCAAVLHDGQILGFVPKGNIPNYNEFYELRQFNPGPKNVSTHTLPEEYAELGFEGPEIPFGTRLLFSCEELPELVIGAEICEDLWAPETPGTAAALAGATLIVNLSASNELVGKDEYRRDLIRMTSARLLCAYAYASAGEGESTQDLVFSGTRLLAENGTILAEGEPFTAGITLSEIDVDRLVSDRRRNNGFQPKNADKYLRIPFHLIVRETELTRPVSPRPFIPGNEGADRAAQEMESRGFAADKDRSLSDRNARLAMVLQLQARGLVQRLSAIGCEKAVIGISGGLDSTLAMLVAAKAFDLLMLPRKNIIAITMPGFGTTKRTKGNAEKLAEALGAELREIPIGEAVKVHFRDIGLAEEDRSVTYENAQARERTQVLMDVANMENGLVIGTGDLSELALGWATYNGDHMSMYGVNAGVPKTLIRYLVRYYAEYEAAGAAAGNEGSGAGDGAGTRLSEGELAEVLMDILDTPVSPELLPPKDGEISQKTEDLVGPYELHDFILYYTLRYGFGPKKIFRLALCAFAEEGNETEGSFASNGSSSFSPEVIFRWLSNFYRRFFASQFKRSCLPDGPKVGSVAVSPRGDLRMPSDAHRRLWLEELEELEAEYFGEEEI